MKVKIEKIKTTLTFLIRCRNHGIIPNFIKNAMKNIYNIFKTPYFHHIPNTIKKHIDIFQNKILSLVIQQKHKQLEYKNKELQALDERLNSQMRKEDFDNIHDNENIIMSRTHNKTKIVQQRKFDKLKENQMRELNITLNDGWFVNKTNVEFPKDVKWLLSLGEKFGLPTSKQNFPLFKVIADGDDIIQTNNDKEQQEIMRTKFTTMLDSHLNKMRDSYRDKFINTTVAHSKTFLKQNKNILILNADKGNVTVAMYKDDYQQRMNEILGDMMTYQRLIKDPTSNLSKKNNELVEELFKNNIISTAEKKCLKTDVAIAPRLYGLPKIHKENFPLRPICSSVNSPSIQLCKYVVNILKNLTKNSKYNVRDSMQFRDKIKNLTIKDEEQMVSFDVVSLFPSIPVDLGLEIIEKRWNEIEEYTNMSKSLFLSILKFCIKDNRYFQYEGRIYKQKKGLPMGSPASPIVADIVMEKLLDTCMEKLKTKPVILTKYVDDLFMIVGENAIQETLTTFNNFNKNIKFTIEKEHNGSIPYLDTLVMRKDNKIEMNWYQKPTASSRILNFHSKHPKQMIINTGRNLINRILNISDHKFHETNKNKIRKILSKNCFPKLLIEKLINEYNIPKSKDKSQEKYYKSMIYIPGLSERFQNSDLYDKDKLQIATRTNNTLKSLFTNTKSRIPLSERHNVIYSIECDGTKDEKCGKIYVGTTKNKLKTRISGHKSDIKLRSQNNIQKTALAEHCKLNNHIPNFDKIRVLQAENNYNRRLTLEMLHINNIPTNKKINYKSDTDNAAYCYRHLTKKRSCNT